MEDTILLELHRMRDRLDQLETYVGLFEEMERQYEEGKLIREDLGGLTDFNNSTLVNT